MTQTLEKTWAGKVFDSQELKDYASFEASLKERFTLEDKKDFETRWANLVKEIEVHLQENPRGPLGLKLAKECMDMINGLYGREYAHLKHTIWEKGFKKGLMEEDHPLKPEAVQWLDTAIDAYYRGRIYAILEAVETKATPALETQWKALLDEMYGDSEALKQDLINVAQSDPKVGLIARQWIQGL